MDVSQQLNSRVISSSPFRPGVTYDLTSSPQVYTGMPPPGPLLARIQTLEQRCNQYASNQIKLEVELNVLKRTVEELYKDKAKPNTEPPSKRTPEKTTADACDAVLRAPPAIRRITYPVQTVAPPVVPNPGSVLLCPPEDWKKKPTYKQLFYGGSPPRPIPELIKFPSPTWSEDAVGSESSYRKW
jgi:hypothetical protein